MAGRRIGLTFLNCAVNPLVRAVLRSPAHRLLSGSLLLVTFLGRRSGQAYTIPVQYARMGETICIVAGTPALTRR